MSKKLNILIVENEENDIEAYLDTIKTINDELKGQVEIVPTVKKTKEEGLLELSKSDWSSAFIDLKLSVGDILHAEEGNEIVREIYKKRRFPVFILTNTPEDVSKEFEQSIFLRINSKDAIDYHTIFMEIVKIHNTGILDILGKRGAIEKYLDEIFWNNISHSLGEWFKVEDPEKPLLRYTLSHFQEYLELSDDGGFDTYYPIETYIFPRIKKYCFTGDIFKIKTEEKYYVVLTPACDLAPHGKECKPKTDRILLAEIENFSDNLISSFIKKAKRADENSLKEQDKIVRMIKNNFADQFFYLPGSEVFKGGVVNFRRLKSVKLNELEGYESKCNLSSQYIKDLIARFSFYYSRQGAPDFNFESLLSVHME